MAVYSDMASAQFENVNSLRSYPFSDISDLVSNDGKIVPSDVIVDLHIVVPSSSFDSSGESSFGNEMSEPVVRMTSLHLSSSMVSACFVSFSGNEKNAVSVIVSRETFVPYMPYRLEKLAGSSDIGGIVTFGDFEFPGVPETYFMDAVVHPCCVSSANPPRLRKFIDPRSGESVSGDVSMSFTGYVGVSKTGNSFHLSLEKGAEEELSSECAKATGAGACGATPISSINGVRPDKNGNIVLWFH